jgi:sulfoxide reductase heme-binding subunit YedZ
MVRARSSRSIPRPAPPEPAGQFPYVLIALVSIGMVVIAVAQRSFGVSFSPATWYIARASGITLYLTLWLATVLGLGLTTKFFDLRLSRGVVFSLHRYATALSFAFLAIHLLSLASDSFSAYTVADLLVPFHAPGREPWIGLGIIAAYLLVFVAAASPLMKFLGYTVWRWTHWLTFPLLIVAFVHGVGAGTDFWRAPVLAMYSSTALVVVALSVIRFAAGPRRPTMAAAAKPPVFDRLSPRP